MYNCFFSKNSRAVAAGLVVQQRFATNSAMSKTKKQTT